MARAIEDTSREDSMGIGNGQRSKHGVHQFRIVDVS